MSDMELNNNMDEFEDAEDLGPITLVDDNNEEHQFELIDTVKYEEEMYAVLAPYDEVNDESVDEVDLVILRMVEEGDEISLEDVDDEDLLDAVYAAFMEANPDLFEEE